MAEYVISHILDAFLYFPAMAFRAALSSIIGQNLDANKVKRSWDG
ncbi:hypothetical protein [Candidatus Borreliella tachyglossi]|nr:hypothetical protein [Candidatus Borreliella tachyglossi]